MFTRDDVVNWLDAQTAAQGTLERVLESDDGCIGIAGAMHGEIHVYGIRKICEVLGVEPIVEEWEGNKYGHNNNIVYTYWNGYQIFTLEDRKNEE